MFQKQPRLTNKRVLELARDRECLLRMAVHCQSGSTVAAHSNFVGSGKGIGMKAHDFMTVWACATCHDALDSGQRCYEEKKRLFDFAHDRQIMAWVEILESDSESLVNKKAVQWALKNFEEHCKNEY